MEGCVERREFLKQSMGTVAGGAALAAVAGRPAGARAATSRVRLGGPSYADSDDPGLVAAWHARKGYRAAYCPTADVTDTARIRAIVDAFAREDIVIAEVGRWVNLLDPDTAKRRENLRIVTEGLALAEAVGARCCVDIAGSFNPEVWYGPHPDNVSDRFFDAAVENARTIIDAVKPRRTTFCYEMMGWSIPDSPASFLKLLKAVDRKAFAVHLDPCNLVNSPARFYGSATLLEECFRTLGPWVVSCHAKDLVWDVEMNIHFREVRPGAGTLDYGAYLRGVAALPRQPPLMLEHLPDAAEYDKARRHLFEVGEKIGVDVGREGA
jgi:sugar phosphate isomerase/epimerase